jgi:hypothetical protein
MAPRACLFALFCLASPGACADEHAAAASECAAHSPDQPLAEAFGSVALMANLRRRPDSIRTVAKELLADALGHGASPLASCPSGCAPASKAVVYRVAPTAYLDGAKQPEDCLALEQQTTVTPFLFPEKHFGTLDDLNDWIMDFTRGKGPEGKALYRMCTSSCSPRYTFVIDGSGAAGFSIGSEVLCGRARDRSNTRYSLSTALRARCARELR